ncbi:hypothetical protein [Deinococcus misasensis]|uniref:hypothetical protein n=1 Tax=Deinococcus misasensis TaxID=392413 RepID=UPI000553582F|nr:hypothetical protein [Deinococcus misasensis]
MFHEHVNQVVWKPEHANSIREQLDRLGIHASIRSILNGQSPPAEAKIRMLALVNQRLERPALTLDDGMGTTWTVYPTRRTPEEQRQATQAAARIPLAFRSSVKAAEVHRRPHPAD